MTLPSYRYRQEHAANDPGHAADEAALHPARALNLQTLVLHGAGDGLNDPDTPAGKQHLFRGGCERKVLQGVGHLQPHGAFALVTTELHRFLACQLPTTAP